MAADLTRCEAEQLQGSFMTLGPRQWLRCGNAPDYVVTGSPVVSGRFDPTHRGQMSMCRECFIVFKEVAPQDSYSYVRLVEVKR